MKVSREGRYAYSLPKSDIKTNSVELLDDKFIRKNKAEFPEVAELDLVRHYTELSNKNFGVQRILSIGFMYDEV